MIYFCHHLKSLEFLPLMSSFYPKELLCYIANVSVSGMKRLKMIRIRDISFYQLFRRLFCVWGFASLWFL